MAKSAGGRLMLFTKMTNHMDGKEYLTSVPTAIKGAVRLREQQGIPGARN
ncbi:MAG: hypothetical protein V1492_05525 [Candidatus Micrarchaeota archaeon]